MTAVDSKPAKPDLSRHPRAKRRLAKNKPVPRPLEADSVSIAVLWHDDKTFRADLWRDFVRFCRQHGAWVVTPPADGRVRVQIPDGSDLVERLRAFPRYFKTVVRLPGVSHRLTHGVFSPCSEIEILFWAQAAPKEE